MIRKQSQLSQEELGKKINVSKQTVSKYEKGIVEPNFHTLVEISKVFNCSLDSLVFGNIKLKSKNPALLNLEIEKKMNLFTKEISQFHIKGTPGFLQAVVIIQLLIGQIGTLHNHTILSVVH